jgi:hypothetical protein
MNPDILEIEEIGVAYGLSPIDIAIASDQLIGYELKSDLDPLDRLPRQVKYYNSIFEEVVLVVGYQHAYEALKMIPNWWGVYFAEKCSNGIVQLSIARDPKTNPNPIKASIAKLLWREELLHFLAESEFEICYRYKTRDELSEKLAEKYDYFSLVDKVCSQLKHRSNWRVDAAHRKYAY